MIQKTFCKPQPSGSIPFFLNIFVKFKNCLYLCNVETNFKIAKFKKEDDNFVKIGYDEYQITYIKGTKVHQLRMVVNGYLTKQTINLVDGNSGYKSKILTGIKEYLDFGHLTQNRVTKKLRISYLENFYSKKVIHNVKTFLLNINKEESRDKLTEFGLI
jgi:hypothetical protein